MLYGVYNSTKSTEGGFYIYTIGKHITYSKGT